MSPKTISRANLLIHGLNGYVECTIVLKSGSVGSEYLLVDKSYMPLRNELMTLREKDNESNSGPFHLCLPLFARQFSAAGKLIGHN